MNRHSAKRALTFAVPGDLATLTGGYTYDRRVMGELRTAGVAVNHCALAASYPFPSHDDVRQTIDQINGCDPAAPVVVDGLAFGAIPHDAARRLRKGLIALCHHPLALEAGLPGEKAAWCQANERAKLALARRFIVPSKTTADFLAREFAVPADRIVVAEPGTDPMPRAAGSHDETTDFLSVGSVVPRKGHDLLLQALEPLKGLPWRLRIAGATDRAPVYAESIIRLTAELQLDGQVEFCGETTADDLARLYHRSDAFVLSSRYEGYGMVLAEAMACGLPVITATGGAAAHTVPDSAALKVPPDDVPSLRRALETLLTNKGLRASLADASWQAGQSLPRWSDTAMRFLQPVDDVAQELSR